MVETLLTAGAAVVSAGIVYTMAAARVVKQYERGVVFRLGRLRAAVRGPGFTLVLPFVDRLHKVNMQIVTMPVPAQEGITRDNVTVRVDAVVYFQVVDPAEALVKVEDYRFAVSQTAQTSLRSIIGKSDLDDLLASREKLNEGLELMIDSPAIGWGVQIDRVEIKDVSLPETMKRSMARQAEADRERRARVINADAELQASKKLSEAAKEMADTPAALQLRLLQTVVAVAAEKNSTLVLPFPVELLRFLERAAPPPAAPAPAPAPAAAPVPPVEQAVVEKGTVEQAAVERGPDAAPPSIAPPRPAPHGDRRPADDGERLREPRSEVAPSEVWE
ncbi:slipin family protein [Streptomyces sp. NPDC001941]|uniref:slipin family protein n=1 Tax=Streptomyces sp. NPDC001941 TaxID=3154659 RepID=UPI00331AFFFC